MSGVQFSQYGGRQAPRDGAPPGRDFQELWFAISRRPWASLVLVPADQESTVGRYATSLADVGGRLRDAPVTVVVAETLDYESVRVLADLQLRVTPRGGDAFEAESRIVPSWRQGELQALPPHEPEDEEGEGEGPRAAPRSAPLGPVGQIILAIPSVEREPLGVALAQAADAVLLCVDLGRSRMKDARRTMELIGADRMTGAVIVR